MSGVLRRCSAPPPCASARTRCSSSRSPARSRAGSSTSTASTTAAELVAAVTRENYPDLRIPLHARARHFVAGEPKLPDGDRDARARAAFDLVIVSVLLDAGAGADWKYRDAASGRSFARSEGLAVASQRMFEAGAFSLDPGAPLRVDAQALAGLDADALALGFQVDDSNPMVGLDGRAALAAPARRAGRRASGPVRDRGRAAARRAVRRAGGAERSRAGCPPPRSSSCCSKRSGRSGPTGWSSTACRSAIAGAIRR